METTTAVYATSDEKLALVLCESNDGADRCVLGANHSGKHAAIVNYRMVREWL